MQISVANDQITAPNFEYTYTSRWDKHVSLQQL